MIKNYKNFGYRNSMPRENLDKGSIFFRKTWQVTCFVLTIFMMAITNANAQASSYVFSKSDGTYVPITGGTVIVSSTNGTPNLDSYVSATQTIPSFTFSGTAYTSMRVTSNGQLSLGTTAPSEYTYTVLSSNTGGNVFLAPFSADLDDNTGVSEIRFETVANEIVVQWKNFKRYGKAESFNFQVRMNTLNGTIKFVYDATPPFATSADYQPQVGIKSNIGVYNFLTVPATGSWNTPVNATTGILDTSICTFNGAVGFTSGLTYTWTAPTCVAPSAVTATNLTLNSATISWTAPSIVPGNGYQYEIRTSGAAGSGATGLVQSGSTAAGVVTQNIAGLTSNTLYLVYVRSVCDATDSSAWSALSTFFTGYCTPPAATGTATYINNFSTTLGSTNISNLASGFTTAGYQDNYATMEVISYAEGIVNYSFSIVGGTTGVAIWVDWNNNLTFETAERVYNSAAYLAAGTYTGSITVPAGTPMGSYRMRVKTDFNNASPNPCTNGGTRAETEDYKFTVGVAPSCLPPTAITATLITNNSATIGWAVSSSTPSNGYQYEVRTSGAAGSGATGLVASGAVTTLTAPITALTANTTYTVFVRSDCGSGLYSGWSVAATFTTLCDAVTAFSENFNAVTTPGFPACWGKVGANGAAYTQNTSAASTPNTLYMYSSTATSRAVVKMQPVSNAGANTHRLRFNLRGNISSGETVEVGYLTDPMDAATFVVLQTYTAATTSYVQKILEPTTAPGTNQVLAFRTGTAMLSVLIDDVVWELNPTDAVDNANLQSFIANNAVVTSLETCQSFDVTARALETGLTEAAGQAAGLVAHIGYSTTNTDPATWPESAWKVATFNADVDNKDEFKATYTPLTAGTYYFASRFVLNGGPAKYGATNNGFWNATTNPNAAITVSAPAAVTAVAATPSFCAGGSTSITASSSNTAMTYLWSEGSTTAAITVSPTTTTTYTVTATNPATGCTSTASVTVTVNPLPTALAITPSASTICEGSVTTLNATGGVVNATLLNETFNSGLTLPAPFTAVAGTGDQITVVNAQTAGGTVNQLRIVGNSQTAVVTNRVSAGPFNTAGMPSVTLSWRNYLNHYSSTYNYSVSVQTSTDGVTWHSTSWSTSPVTAAQAASQQTLAINNADVGSATFYVAFIVTGQTFGMHNWNIDDVMLTGTASGDVIWSPTADLYTDAAATVPYTGTAATTVYVKGSATTPASYTATVTNSFSCSASVTASITVTPNLAPDFAAIPAICSGSTAPTLATTSPNGVTGTWSPATVSNTASGSYVFTPAAGQCATTQTLTVTVNTTAAPTGTSPQDYTTGETLADFDVTGTGIVWYDAPTNGNVLPASTPLVSNVTYYASQTLDGCESPTRLAVTAGQNLKVDSVNFKSLKYYPNPVNNVLTVSYSQEITGLKLYNMVGQQLMVKKANATETQLDMSNLPAGSYLLEVSSGANSKTVKLLKN